VVASRLLAVPQTLDAVALRRWCAGGLRALRRHQAEINRLNVYPVPDGDTGTNLLLTLTAAQEALGSAPDPGGGPDPIDEAGAAREAGDDEVESGRSGHAGVLRRLARGALLGARGNSGVILAQVLRGLADALADVPVVRGRALAAGLRAASTAAYAAVAAPVEGTLLTVVAAAATGAERADSDDLPTVARAAATAADQALARTPEQLPELASAGVVDAGGRGFCLLLHALVEALTGVPPAVRFAELPGPPATAVRETGSPEYAYEVQYLLDATPDAVGRLRTDLARLGDSLVMVGDGASGEVGTWHVHVHVNDVGAAIEAGVVAGRPYQISVTRFADGPGPGAPTVAADASGSPRPPAATEAAGRPAPGAAAGAAERAAVVVADGSGLAEILAAEGATAVAPHPSAGGLLAAIRSTGAREVVVLPTDRDSQAARAAAEEAETLGVRVSVVPTRSPVQALAALAVRDPSRRFADDVIAMAEAAGACRYAEVCPADREALTVAGRCQPGDVLGLVDGEVHLIGRDLETTCRELLDRMLGGGGELVTLLLGADAPPGLGEALRAHLARRWPFVEVHHYVGGQPFYPLLVGVE